MTDGTSSKVVTLTVASNVSMEEGANMNMSFNNAQLIGQNIQHISYAATNAYFLAQEKEDNEFGNLSDDNKFARAVEKLGYYNTHFREEYSSIGAEPFIPLRGREKRDPAALVFDVHTKVAQFLKELKKRVLLLLGDAGSGKSRFARELALNLEDVLKESCDYVPLFVQLPALDQDAMVTSLVESALRARLGGRYVFTEKQLDFLREHAKILFVLDSYDEAFPNKQFQNIAVSNDLYKWKSSKFIFSCRTQDFINNLNCNKQYFVLQENGLGVIQEINIEPFQPQHIKEYIRAYLAINEDAIENSVGSEWTEEGEYLGYLFGENSVKKLTGLDELARLPLSLKVTMEALPKIVSLYKQEMDDKKRTMITERDLYEALFEQRFERQWSKRIMTRKTQGMHGVSFRANCWEFAMLLAVAMGATNTYLYYEPEAILTDTQHSPAARFFSNDPLPEDGNTPEERITKRAMWIAARDGCMIRTVQ